MKLVTKAAVTIAFIATIIVGTGYLLNSKVIFGSFNDLEASFGKKNINRAEQALQKDLDSLVSHNHDWAVWDDTYNKGLGLGNTYYDSALPTSVFQNSRLDYMAIYHSKNGLQAALWADPELPKVAVPPEAETSRLRKLYQHYLENGQEAIAGLVRFGDHFAQVSISRATRSDSSFDDDIALVSVRLVNDNLIKHLRELTDLDLQIDSRGAPPEPSGSISVSYPEETVIALEKSVKDINGQHLFNFRLEQYRIMYLQAIETRNQLALPFVLLSIIGTIVAIMFIQHAIVSPIRKIQEHVANTREDSISPLGEVTSQNDEIAWLAKDIDTMLGKLAKYQEQLKEARHDALAASKSKSQFLANMSHEIRTPMTAILGYAELLQDESLSPEQRNKYIRTINNNGQLLLSIINDILDMSRIESGNLVIHIERCSLGELLQNVLGLLSNKATKKGLYLDVIYETAVPDTIATDPIRFQQIMVNLLENAIKFTRNGGIKVKLSWHDSEQPLHIDVIDTGIGLSQADIQQLFKPFTQVDSSATRAYSGSGLGLSISSALASKMNASVTASSEKNIGSTFTFALDPGEVSSDDFISALPNNLPDVPEPSLDTKARFTGNALLVEDNEANRLLLKSMLAKLGFTVTQAENGEEALKQLEESNFDIIFMDMQMPVMDGYSATKEIRRRGLELPVIALTANVMNEDRQLCLEAGCDAFLGKPVKIHQISEIAAEFVGN